MSWKSLLLGVLTASGLGVGVAAHSQVPDTATEFVHGRWFDGRSFVRGEFYAVHGVLQKKRPTHVDEVVDLHDGWVIPPFGDAHEHNFDATYNTPGVVSAYLRDGIFYAQGMTDVTSGAIAVVKAGMVDTPTTVDVTYAHGSITAVHGHPKEVYEQYALGFYQFPLSADQLKKIAASTLAAGEAYWELDSPAELEAAWPKILAAKPDLIKIMLVESENYAAEDPKMRPLGKGLDPLLVPLVTAKAHAAGLKVAAHVETAADFHVAVTGGVDEMAHLPGYDARPETGLAQYHLADADIALAAKKKIKMIATASLSDNEYVTEEGKAATRSSQLDNLPRLKKAGVEILVGSDHYGQDSLQEWKYLHGLGVWSNAELLRMYTKDTPQDIFPKRRIGELREGYEASFLVLKENPLVRWEATMEIQDRWKQGQHVLPKPDASNKANGH